MWISVCGLEPNTPLYYIIIALKLNYFLRSLSSSGPASDLSPIVSVNYPIGLWREMEQRVHPWLGTYLCTIISPPQLAGLH